MKTFSILLLCLLSFNTHSQILGTNESLFDLRNSDNIGKTPEEVYEESFQTYKRFMKIDVNAIQHNSISANDVGKRTYITSDEANIAYNALISNPVVSAAKSKHYDPSAQTGFCFGRAMFVNLYLAASGLNRANMKKAFILGSMDGGVWGWHVATTVQSRDPFTGAEKWLVIDSEVGKVVELFEWYNYWRTGSSDDKKLRLYITDVARFGASPSKYDERGISDKRYRNYFRDMMYWFDNEFTPVLFSK